MTAADLDAAEPCRVVLWECPEPATVPVVWTIGQTGPLPYPLSFRTETVLACPAHARLLVDPVLTRRRTAP